MEDLGELAGSAAHGESGGGWVAIRSPEGVRDVLLLLMALTSGYMDAVSFFGLGHVFTSVMTGNTVLLAVALSQARWLDVTHTLTALASYLAGVAAGTLVLERGARQNVRQGVWPVSVTVACLLELGVLLAFAAGGVLAGGLSGGGILYVLIALAAFAMGTQSTAARALNVPGITTTYFTGTWTSLMEGITRRLRARAGRRNRATPEREPPSKQTLARQGAVLCSYFFAAIAGGVSVIRWQLRAAVFPAVPLALLVGIAWYRFHRVEAR